MNSRERVTKVLNHEIPDRIPNCWGGCELLDCMCWQMNDL